MNKHILVTSLAIVLTTAAFADAGVGYRFRSARNGRNFSRFNFAVSETKPTVNRRWTAQDFSGEALNQTRAQRRRMARRIRVRRANMGPWFATFMARQRQEMRREDRQPEGESGAGVGGAGGGGQGIGGGSSAGEQTSRQTPVNAGYCYCPGIVDPPGGGGGGGTGGDDDDDDNGGGGGGGPDPSVVPEPGSFALWALAGCLLVGVTRRKKD